MSLPELRLTSLGGQVLGRYRDAGPAARLYLGLRWRWTPYEQIAAQVASQGLILDLGAGHGLLSLAMALSAPARRIRGIDHSACRVAIAQRAAADLPNVEFATGNLLDAVADNSLCGNVAAIIILDALHYLTFEEQEIFLQRCRRALQPDGVLLIRDVDAGAGKSFFINRWHERVMTGLGFTRADKLIFRSRSEWLQLLARADFDCVSEPCSRYPFADLLFVGKKTASQAALAA